MLTVVVLEEVSGPRRGWRGTGSRLHATCSIAELFLSCGAFVGSMKINHGAGFVQFHRNILALFQPLGLGFLMEQWEYLLTLCSVQLDFLLHLSYMNKFSRDKPMRSFFSCEMRVDHRIILVQHKGYMVTLFKWSMAVPPFLIFIELIGGSLVGLNVERAGFLCHHSRLLLMGALMFFCRGQQDIVREWCDCRLSLERT